MHFFPITGSVSNLSVSAGHILECELANLIAFSSYVNIDLGVSQYKVVHDSIFW